MNNDIDNHDDVSDEELDEIQRGVVAFAIEAAEAVIAANVQKLGPHPDPSRRVHAIADVVIHATNAYATVYHVDSKDWYRHRAETAIAALSGDNYLRVRQLIAEIMPTRWDPDTNTHTWA